MSNLFALRNKATGEYLSNRYITTKVPEEAKHWKRYSDARRFATRSSLRFPDTEVVAFKFQEVPYESPDEQKVLKFAGVNPTPKTLACALLKYMGRAAYDERVDAIARLITKVNLEQGPPLPANKTLEVTLANQPTVVA